MGYADDFTQGPWGLLLAAALGLAVVGFFTGTDPDPPGESPLRAVAEVDDNADAAPAPRYLDRRTTTPRGADGFSESAAILASTGVTEPTGDRRAALNERAGNRAFAGAPPRIPHPFDMGTDGACLACHQDGLAFGDRKASAMPHDSLTACTQCHVAAVDLIPGGDDLGAGMAAIPNHFEGLAEPIAGDRAWSIAPPQVPHTTWMREDCMSCHGAFGSDPLVTPHPDRQSCTQCHAPSDAMDQGGVR